MAIEIEDILEGLELMLNYANTAQAQKLNYAATVQTNNAKAENDLMIANVNNMNVENRELKNRLIQNIKEQEKNYLLHTQRLEDIGAIVTDWTELSDEDITDAGLTWIEDNGIEAHERVFDSLSSLTRNQMDVTNLDRLHAKNQKILDNLDIADERINRGQSFYEEMGKDLDIKNLRDRGDAQAWLDNNIGENGEKLGDLEVLAYKAGLPEFFKDELAMDKYYVKDKIRYDVETGKSTNVSVVDITNNPNRYINVGKLNFDNRVKMNALKKIDKQFEEDEKEIVGWLNNNRKSLSMTTDGVNIENKKYVYGGKGGRIEHSDYVYDLEKMKSVSDEGFDAHNQRLMVAKNIVKLSKNLVQEGWGGIDMGIADDLITTGTENDIVETAERLITPGTGQTIIGHDSMLRADIFDITGGWKQLFTGKEWGGTTGLGADETNAASAFIEANVKEFIKLSEYIKTLEEKQAEFEDTFEEIEEQPVNTQYLD